MRIRPHHAPVHRKRLHLSIHTLLADLHITIRIERHHRAVYLPLRTRRNLHIPELPHTLHIRTTLKQPDRQRISKSTPLQPQPNNNPSQCQCSPAPPKEPLLSKRSQIFLMQMITRHPEQHILHRKQRQCRKQVNPLPIHKRKPTSRRKPRHSQNSYQCHCRPPTSKILANENVPHCPPNEKNSPESCITPQITPKFERLIHLSPLQSTNNLHEILYHVLGVLH